MIGMITAGIHAPSVNFETTTTRATTPVVKLPTPLMTALARQFGSFRRKWCRTMPAWLRVNPVNTPNAYSGISALMLPLKMMTRMPAMTASTMMPLENTSRSPRLANWRGRNPSRAMIDDRRGKSA